MCGLNGRFNRTLNREFHYELRHKALAFSMTGAFLLTSGFNFLFLACRPLLFRD